MIDTGAGVAELQSRWRSLCDLDRARAVQSIHQAGMSLQELAPHLNCSPSLLSYLLRALQAPAKDRELARLGDITTRELVRRARSSGTRPNSIQRESLAFDRECVAVQAGHAIKVWLDEQSIPSADQEQIMDQASSLTASVKRVDLGSLGASLPDIPLVEIIRLFRPADLGTNDDHSIAWFAQWLGDEPNIGEDAGVVEKLVRQGDDGVEPVVLDDPASDIGRAGTGIAAEQGRAIEDDGDLGSLAALSGGGFIFEIMCWRNSSEPSLIAGSPAPKRPEKPSSSASFSTTFC